MTTQEYIDWLCEQKDAAKYKLEEARTNLEVRQAEYNQAERFWFRAKTELTEDEGG